LRFVRPEEKLIEQHLDYLSAGPRTDLNAHFIDCEKELCAWLDADSLLLSVCLHGFKMYQRQA